MTDLKCPRCGVELENHEAGRCLDEWIAEKVMGWKRVKAYCYAPPGGDFLCPAPSLTGNERIPAADDGWEGSDAIRMGTHGQHQLRVSRGYERPQGWPWFEPSRTPAGMWAVVEEMRRQGLRLTLVIHKDGRTDARFDAIMGGSFPGEDWWTVGHADTAFLACCRAALKAVGEGKV